MGLIELLIVVLLLLWLFGYFGRGRLSRRGPDLPSAPPWGGSWLHTLLVIAVILIILRVLRIV